MNDLDYQLRDDGIHVFQFIRPSREAVIELFDIMQRAVEAASANDMILIITDASNGVIPPLRQLFASLKAFTQGNPNPNVVALTAVIHDTTMIVSILDSFLATIAPFARGQNRTRFFRPDQRDRAEAWLLEERDKVAKQ